MIASFVLCLSQTFLADDINIIPIDSLLWWSQDASQQPLDAEFLNVYQGAHGVVMLFDVTKQWYVYTPWPSSQPDLTHGLHYTLCYNLSLNDRTWQYVEREVPKVPLHIPILVLVSKSKH